MSSSFTTEQDRRLNELYEAHKNGRNKFWETIVNKMNEEFKRERPFTHESLRSRFKVLRGLNKDKSEGFGSAAHPFAR